MDNSLHLIKLCVGAEQVQDLIDWQGSPRALGPDGLPRHVTRMWPKREKELLKDGSLYMRNTRGSLRSTGRGPEH